MPKLGSAIGDFCKDENIRSVRPRDRTYPCIGLDGYPHDGISLSVSKKEPVVKFGLESPVGCWIDSGAGEGEHSTRQIGNVGHGVSLRHHTPFGVGTPYDCWVRLNIDDVNNFFWG